MKYLLHVFFLLCFFSSLAQDKNKFYALDANLNETVLDSSKYILWVHEIDGANWQFDYYRTWGSLVKTQTFADRQGMVLNGRSSIYNSFGNIDSTGVFDHGKRNGVFMKFTSLTKDSFIQIRHYEYLQDSLLKKIELTTSGVQIPDSIKINPASYPDGPEAFNKYMALQLVYPDRAKEKSIQGKTVTLFAMDSTAKASDFFPAKSVEYSIDQEIIRVLKAVPMWISPPGQENKSTQYYYQSYNMKMH